jgi:cytochrome P450
MSGLPAPATTIGLGHLRRWTFDPVGLLEEGARTGPVFGLRLWRRVIVGYHPAWNRALLGNLETFRSRRSLSDLTPYLAGGIVHADVPAHDERRRELNPHFHSRALAHLHSRLAAVVDDALPDGPFDALAWSALVVRRLLNAAFFGGEVPDGLLAQFFAPLQRKPPSPLLPRPLLFHRMDAAIGRAMHRTPGDALAAGLVDITDPVEEIRVALAAGFDTTAHTLAWAVWHLAGAPEWRRVETLRYVLDEVLRLYPAGWLGTRIAREHTTIGDVDIPAGVMVMYSPYLTHRSPDLWPDPTAFRPERHIDSKPAWGFIPFSAGRRTCLGTHLARLMLLTVLERLCSGDLRQLNGDTAATTGISLRPAGPLWVARSAIRPDRR